MERAIDSGMLHGLLNGARGIGYVGGWLRKWRACWCACAQPRRLELGGTLGLRNGLRTLIIFTGLSSVFGGWGLLWKWKKLRHLM